MKAYKPKYNWDLAIYFKYVGVFTAGSHKGEVGAYFNRLTAKEKKEAVRRQLEVKKVKI